MRSWVLTVVGTVVLGLAVAGPAAADVVTVHDATDDVWFGTTEADVVPTHDTRANADILRTRVKHGKRFVRAAVTEVDLVRSASVRQVQIALRVPGGQVFSASWGADEDDPVGGHWLYRDRGPRVRCPGMAHSVDYAADVVRLAVPRRCLGRPHWVRFQAVTASFEDLVQEIAYLDDGRSREGWPQGWSRRLWRA